VGIFHRNRLGVETVREFNPTLGRDAERAPLPWDNGPFYGFSDVQPWLDAKYTECISWSDQRNDDASVWNWYREMLSLRRTQAIFLSGAYRTTLSKGGLWCFMRYDADTSIHVLLNFRAKPQRLRNTALPREGKVLLGSHRQTGGHLNAKQLTLAPFEVVVLS